MNNYRGLISILSLLVFVVAHPGRAQEPVYPQCVIEQAPSIGPIDNIVHLYGDSLGEFVVADSS